MRPSVVLPLAALALAGCSDRAITPAQPDEPAQAAAVAGPRLSISAGAAALDVSHEVGDLVQRVLPSFTDAEAAGAVQAQLQDLAAKAAAGDRAGAAQALEAARAAVTPGATGAADAAAIQMTLDVIQRELSN